MRFVPFFVIGAAWTFTGALAVHGFEGHHDGLMYVPALRVAHGEAPYRDVFSTYGPAVVLLQALALRVFGEALLVLRLLTSFFYGLNCLLLWRIFTRLMPPGFAAAAALGWLALAPFSYLRLYPWSSVYAIFFQLAALELALRGLDRPSRRLDVAAGACVAIAFFCRQSVGFFEAIALPAAVAFLVVSGVLSRARALAFARRFAVGLALATLPFVAYLGALGALEDFWRQYFEYMFLAWGLFSGGLLSGLSKLFPGRVALDLYPHTMIWILLPSLHLAAFGWLLLRGLRRRPVDARLWLLVAVSGASWSQYVPNPDIRHVFWSAAPMLGLPVYLLYRQWRQVRLGPSFLVPLAAALVVLGIEVGKRIDGFELLHGQPHVRMASPPALAGMFVRRSRAEAVHELVSLVESRLEWDAGLDVVLVSNQALYAGLVTRPARLHKIYLHFPGTYDPLYPDYRPALEAKIASRRSLLLADPGDRFEGYRLVESFRDTLHVALLAPADAAGPRAARAREVAR